MNNLASVFNQIAISRGGLAVALRAIAFAMLTSLAVAQDAVLPMSPQAIAQQAAASPKSANGQPVFPTVGQAPPMTLQNCSFIYQKAPPEAEMRELKINDIITV